MSHSETTSTACSNTAASTNPSTLSGGFALVDAESAAAFIDVVSGLHPAYMHNPIIYADIQLHLMRAALFVRMDADHITLVTIACRNRMHTLMAQVAPSVLTTHCRARTALLQHASEFTSVQCGMSYTECHGVHHMDAHVHALAAELNQSHDTPIATLHALAQHAYTGVADYMRNGTFQRY